MQNEPASGQNRHSQSVAADGYRWVSQDCPICEVPPTKFLGKRGGSAHREGLGVTCEIWQCGKCKLLFPNPMPIPIGGMEQHYKMETGEYFKHHDEGIKCATAENLLNSAAKLIGMKGRLLDVGAGKGELLKTGREMGWECVGIELSPTFAEYAAPFSGAEVRRDPIESCNFDEASFDVVILSAVLEHLYNPDETIREIARVLRPGGALFMDVPNERGLYFRVGNLYLRLCNRDWVVNLAPTFPPFHIFGFGGRSLRRLLGKHGLRPVNLRFYGGISLLESGGSTTGGLEVLASRAVSYVSRIGSLGTYVQTWAIKQ
jgi:SAM-dependent methyltransferase